MKSRSAIEAAARKGARSCYPLHGMTDSSDSRPIIPAVAANICFLCFILLLVIYGGYCAGIILREPDVCFLLAVGRWIVEHGQLPAVDPFSWGYLLFPPGKTYVVYQWLADVIFYSLYRFTTARGLVVFCAAMLATAFIAMPARLLVLGKVNKVKIVGFGWLIVSAAALHSNLRPEIFSYVLLMVLLEMIMWFNSASVDKVHWRFIAASAGLAVIWCNLHCLFVMEYALLGLLLFCLAAVYAWKLACRVEIPRELARSERARMITVAVSLVAAIAASLLNPRGVELWPYTMQVLFTPLNKTIVELQPLGIMDCLFFPYMYPFLLFLAIAVTTLIKRRWNGISCGGDLYARLLIVAGIAGILKAQRMIQIASMFWIAAIAALEPAREPSPESFSEQVNKELSDVVKPTKPLWFASYVLIAAAGALFITQIVPPDFPQGSKAFIPPYKAIAYLEKNGVPPGRFFTDAHFGDVIMWNMHNPPKVYVDSRYYMYDPQMMADYWDMMLVHQNWFDLLEKKYKIDWAMIPPNLPLARALSALPSWNRVYADDAAVICVRNHKHDQP